ncbi:hypothetical protein F5Y18DRAFT_423054 [Xylariaceae sp. FL1019]|nr:hypothetical protein F5Y18DRAFT_423054 [Xylariaceae sp. FL1019]
MYFKAIVLILPSLASAIPTSDPSPQVQLQEAFNPPTIISSSFSGNGCPQTAQPKLISSTWSNFSFRLPAFEVSTDGGVQAKTQNCQAHLNLGGGTPGWAVALRDLWSTGHVTLEGEGVTLTEYLTVYFSQDAGSTATATQSITNTGNSTIPRNLNWHTIMPSEDLIWSPCIGEDGDVGIVNVNFRVALTSSDANAYGYYGAGVNSSVQERFGWVWRQCSSDR